MPLREYVINNFGWKLISLLLAMLIWYNIHSSHPDEVAARHPVNVRTTREFPKLPITVLTDAAGMRGYVVRPEFVKVVVGDDAEGLKKLAAKDIQVFVNLTDLAEPDDTMQKINVFLPAGASLVEVTPPFVHVERVKPAEAKSAQ